MLRGNKKILGGVLLIAAVAAAIFLFFPGKKDIASLRKGRNFNVILITLDTTRADRLGCYGFDRVETPVIDGFAESGVLFKKCYSPTPLTLPAHTSILTGTLPPFHGIRDNGGFVVPSGITTMAELFKDRGYATSAFVASYVLDSKWGLDQGFDTYFDNFNLNRMEEVSLGTIQRPADEVLDETLPWLEKNKTEKFFAWIHLYDPHTPYAPPSPFDRSYSGTPYLGEIAFMDSQLGRLRSFLDGNGLLENTIVILAGDHGESLGEHDEGAHGFFVYQGAIHVPLIIVTPFSRYRGVSTSRIASLSDILPTVCDLTGIAPPSGMQGKSLLDAFDNPKATPVGIAYSETFYPRYHYGWSELMSIQDNRYKLILAPVPELYDLVQDPGEEKNLVYLRKDVFEAMSRTAEKFIAESGRNAYETDPGRIDEETKEKLAALGYIGSFTDSSKLKGKKLANPREKIAVFNELTRAREIGLTGNAEEALRIITDIIAGDPRIPEAYFSLGNVYFKAGRFEEAIAAFRKSLEIKPDDTFAVLNIANSYIALRKPDEAENFILDFTKKGNPDSQLFYFLGNLNAALGKAGKAAEYYAKSLALNPRSAASHNALAAAAINRDEIETAERHIRAALDLDPRLAGLHFNLAQLREKQNRIGEAVEAYEKEISLTPGHYKAMFNLSVIYRKSGDEGKEMELLKRCMEADPAFPLSYFYLARIYLRQNRNLEEAISLVNKGIELKPKPEDLPLGYFLLADLYNRTGDSRRSEEFARKGQALVQSR